MAMIESKLKPRPYKRVRDELNLEDIRLIWRNFAGEAGQYNAAGKRNFAIALPEDLALELYDIGWNVKDNVAKVNRGDAQEVLYHLPVTVRLDGKRPARMFMVTASKNSRTLVDEETAPLLDYGVFDKVALKLNPYNYDVNGNQGVTAYLKTLFVWLQEDDLELKYGHIPIDNEPLELENIIDVEGEWVDDDETELENIQRKAIEA